MKLEIIQTGDNSPSLYNEELNETYHSKHGARQESEHVYIKSGLEELTHLPKVRVFEMGFGTGLNIMLTGSYAKKQNQKIDVTSIEVYPLEEEIWSNLNYATNEFEKEIFQKIHQLPWEEKGAVDAQMSLTKLKMDLADVSSKGAFDIIYYDAFGPDKQPHLWTPKIFNILFEILDMGGIFVTYSAKGQVRRDLVSAGFEIERIPGPPGKREMLRGRKK